MKVSRRSGGFSLVELMVVLAIIAVLMAVALPTMSGAKRRAQDAATQATLVAGLKTEEIYATDDGTYSSEVAVLTGLEPSLDWTGGNDASIHIVLGTSVTTNDSILLYARSKSGTWFGLRHDLAGVGTGRLECFGAASSDVDGMADCTGHDW